MFVFDINKYMGKWYELVHYPSWFQRNDDYNTTAEYTLKNDGNVMVHNSTIVQGKVIESYGTAKVISSGKFRVDFDIKEIKNVVNSGQFQQYQKGLPDNVSNYVIDKIWLNQYGEYIFAIVTDATKSSLYLLSRYAQPNLEDYNDLMTYIIANYDRDRLVQTPHYV
jgi:apolipoprotein D and lipocalin family protein